MFVAILIIGIIVVIFGFAAFTGAPYVPSHRRDVRRLFREDIKVKAGDVVLDIGSGDGVVLREAVAAGASRAIGYEIQPFFVALSRFISRKDTRVVVKLANFWQVKFPHDTTIVYTFAVKRDIGRLYKKIQKEATRLDRTITFISYGTKIPGKTDGQEKGAYWVYSVQPLHTQQA